MATERRERINFGPDFCGYTHCNICFADIADDEREFEDSENIYYLESKSSYRRKRSEDIHYRASFAKPDGPMPTAADIARAQADDLYGVFEGLLGENVNADLAHGIHTDRSRDMLDARMDPETVFDFGYRSRL